MNRRIPSGSNQLFDHGVIGARGGVIGWSTSFRMTEGYGSTEQARFGEFARNAVSVDKGGDGFSVVDICEFSLCNGALDQLHFACLDATHDPSRVLVNVTNLSGREPDQIRALLAASPFQGAVDPYTSAIELTYNATEIAAWVLPIDHAIQLDLHCPGVLQGSRGLYAHKRLIISMPDLSNVELSVELGGRDSFYRITAS